MKKECLTCADVGVGDSLRIVSQSSYVKDAGSVSTVVSKEGFMNSAGNGMVVPYKISQEVPPRSGLNVERRPRSTIGNASVHRRWLWHLRACFNVRWKRSTRPLLAGWYGVVRIR